MQHFSCQISRLQHCSAKSKPPSLPLLNIRQAWHLHVIICSFGASHGGDTKKHVSLPAGPQSLDRDDYQGAVSWCLAQRQVQDDQMSSFIKDRICTVFVKFSYSGSRFYWLLSRDPSHQELPDNAFGTPQGPPLHRPPPLPTTFGTWGTFRDHEGSVVPAGS